MTDCNFSVRSLAASASVTCGSIGNPYHLFAYSLASIGKPVHRFLERMASLVWCLRVFYSILFSCDELVACRECTFCRSLAKTQLCAEESDIGDEVGSVISVVYLRYGYLSGIGRAPTCHLYLVFPHHLIPQCPPPHPTSGGSMVRVGSRTPQRNGEKERLVSVAQSAGGAYIDALNYNFRELKYYVSAG